MFISSTFEDMNDERDVLIRRTFPHLRHLASEREVTLTVIDLRWGITQEESQSGKVVDICFREIENCIPFFIGIIGSRYGWIPKRGDLTEDTIIHHNEIEDYLSRELSITEMEIQFGILERAELTNAFFYVKSDSDDNKSDNPEKLKQLKEKVIGNARYPVHYYNSPNSLQKEVEADFISLLNRLFPAMERTPYERLLSKNTMFIRQHAKNYVDVMNIASELDRVVLSETENSLCLSGGCGMGKSSAISYWVSLRRNDFNIVFCDIRLFANAYDEEGLLDYITTHIACIYNIEMRFPFNTGKNSERLEYVLNYVSESYEAKTLVIIFDGLNYFASRRLRLLNWVPSARRKIKIIYSTRSDDSTQEILDVRRVRHFRIQGLSQQQRIDVTNSCLSYYSKTLERERINRIAACELCQYPDVLTSFLNELVNHCTYNALDTKIESLIQVSLNVDTFYQYVVKSYMDDSCMDREYVICFLALLAMCKTGIEEQTIISVTGATSLAWSQFYCSFDNDITRIDGRLSISNDNLKRMVERIIILSGDWDISSLRNNLIDHLEKDSYTRVQIELLHQYVEIKDWDKLYSYLLQLEVFELFYENKEMGILRFWGYLIEHNEGDRYTISAYYPQILNEKSRERRYKLLKYLIDFAIGLFDLDLAKKASKELLLLAENPEERYSAYHCLLQTSDVFLDAIKYSEKAITILQKELPDNASGLQEIYSSISDCYRNNNNYSKALEFNKKREKLFTQKIKKPQSLLGEIFLERGQIYLEQGLYDKAMNEAKKAKDFMLPAFGHAAPEIMGIYLLEGNVLVKQNRRQDAIRMFQDVLNTLIGFAGERHPGIGYCLLNIGKIYSLNQGDESKSLECYQKALSIFTTVFEETAPQMAEIYVNIGEIQNRIGKKESALANIQKGIDIFVKYPGKEAELSNAYFQLGCIQSDKEAIDSLLKANHYACHGNSRCQNNTKFTIWTTLCASYIMFYKDTVHAEPYGLSAYQGQLADKETPNSDIAFTCYALGTTYILSKRYEDAILYLEKSLDYSSIIIPGELLDFDICKVLERLAIANAELKKYSVSLKYSLEQEKKAREQYGENNEEYFQAISNIGSSYYLLQDYDKAIAYLSRSFSWYEKQHFFPEQCGDFFLLLGKSYHALGQYKEAENVLIVYKKHFDTGNSRMFSIEWQLGDIYRALCDWDKAADAYAKCQSIIENDPDAQVNPDYITILYRVSESSWNSYRDKLAFEAIEKALLHSKNVFGEKHPIRVKMLLFNAYIHGRTGNRSRENEILKQVLGLCCSIVDGDYRKTGELQKMVWESSENEDDSAFKKYYSDLSHKLSKILSFTI